jgi:hypothetical protein
VAAFYSSDGAGDQTEEVDVREALAESRTTFGYVGIDETAAAMVNFGDRNQQPGGVVLVQEVGK